MSEYDRLWREINGLKKNVRGLSQPQLAFSTVEDGYVTWRDGDGNPRMRIGLQGDGTQTIKHVAGPKPPAPSAPVVTPDLSTLLVAWDGRFTGPRPEDWDRVDVHVSQDQAFTPSSDTLRGSIVSQDGGDLTLRVTGGTWCVRLVAVSKAEVHSDPSEPSTAKVEGITDRVKADIEKSEGRLSEAQQKALEELAELDRKLAGVGEKAEEATLSARNAHNVAVEAQSAADDALAKYGPLDQRTIDAQKAAKDAQAKAEEAYSTAEGMSGDVAKAKADADTAKQEALAAKTSATNAQTKADQAKSSASQAQTKADLAQQKADQAQVEASQAQTVADDALAKYGPLDKRTIDAQRAASDARGRADSAKQAADKAQADADTAKLAADKAQADATTAKTVADGAKKRADDAYALARSKLSAAEVDKRILQSANGKNTITVSTSAPGSASGIAGDLWRRVDSNGHVFAEWVHDGSAWKPALIRSDMITNLDVHKLTVSGSARVEDAVIEKLWVDGLVGKSATFQHLTVASGNLVPNGDFSQGLEHWRESPNWEVVSVGDIPGLTSAVKATGSVGNAYTGPVFPLDSSRRYRFECWMKASKPGSRFFLEIRNQDGTLVVRNSQVVEGPFTTVGTYPIANSLVPTSWAKAVIEFDVTDGSTSGRVATLYFNHRNGATTDADVYMTGIKLYPVDGVVQLVDGQVTAPKITASQELTAKIAQFLTVRAGQIEADAIDGMTITGATVQTAKSGPRVVLNTAGLSQYDATGTKVVNLSSATGNASIIGEITTGRPGNFRTTITPDLWSNITMKDWDGSDVFASGAGVRIGKDTDIGRYGDIVFAEISGSSGQVIDPETEELEGTTTTTKPALVASGPGQTMTDRANLGLYGDGSVLLRSKDGSPLTLRSQTNRGDYIRLVGNGSVKIRSTGGAGLSLTKEGQVILKPGLGGKDSARLYMYDSVILQTRGGDPAQLRTGNDRANLTVGASGGEITLRGDNVRLLSGSFYYQGHPTSGATPNVYMNSSGWVARATSSRRYKHDIQDFTVPDALLDVPFRTWIDKGEYERNGANIEGLARIPGLIAEEVAQACPELVIYDDKGRPDALAGDRIGMAALTLIRRQRDRITRLEERITQMEGAK